MIFPFWFVDESALAYGSSSWTNPAISMQLYRYNFTTVDFQASCTGTTLGCTGTICPLPLFHQVVPVQVWVVPVQDVYCHFSSKLYRYKFGLYRYKMSTATFPASCTGTRCPLVLSLLCWGSRDFVNYSPTSIVLHIGFPGIHPCALTF